MTDCALPFNHWCAVLCCPTQKPDLFFWRLEAQNGKEFFYSWGAIMFQRSLGPVCAVSLSASVWHIMFSWPHPSCPCLFTRSLDKTNKCILPLALCLTYFFAYFYFHRNLNKAKIIGTKVNKPSQIIYTTKAILTAWLAVRHMINYDTWVRYQYLIWGITDIRYGWVSNT